MIIRNDQLDAMRRDRRPELVERLLAHLKTYHAGSIAGFDDGELRRRIRLGLARADRYGFLSHASLAAFVATMFEVAPNFDEHPRLQAGLLDTSVSLDSRMLDLVQRTTEADWIEAEESYDEGAWLAEPGGQRPWTKS